MSDCPICLDPYDGLEITFQCNHKYHLRCVENMNTPQCPECRYNFLNDVPETLKDKLLHNEQEYKKELEDSSIITYLNDQRTHSFNSVIDVIYKDKQYSFEIEDIESYSAMLIMHVANEIFMTFQQQVMSDFPEEPLTEHVVDIYSTNILINVSRAYEKMHLAKIFVSQFNNDDHVDNIISN